MLPQAGKNGAHSPLASLQGITHETRAVSERFSEPGIYHVDGRGTGDIVNDSITIRNIGSSNIRNPWIVANGKRDWFDLNTLARAVYGTASDSNLKAFLLWSFLKDHRYHWYPAEESGEELHDAVRYLNVYGYGFCDDTARTAEALLVAGGFGEPCIWWLEGHVVAEAYYDGGRHAFDPDLEVFYPGRDNQTVASVQDLSWDGELVRRVSDEYIESLYTSSWNNRPAQKQWEAKHTMGMVLRPGESMERSWHNRGKYHDLVYGVEPPVYGNGKIVYAPPLATAYARDGFLEKENVVWGSDSDLGTIVHRARGDKPGQLGVVLESPYVVVGGAIRLGYFAKTNQDRIRIYFSKMSDYALPQVAEIAGPTSGSTTWSLDEVIGTQKSAGIYRFGVRIVFDGTAADSVGIHGLELEGDIQCSQMSLPALEAGRMNVLEARMEPSEGAILEVVHRYRWRVDGASPPGVSDMPIRPALGGATSEGAPSLEWAPVASSGLAGYRISLSWDEGGMIPVAPELFRRQLGAGPSFAVPAGWLLQGNSYYWRVQGVGANGLAGDWSAPWDFSVVSRLELPFEISGLSRPDYRIDALEPGKLVYCDAGVAFATPIPAELRKAPFLMTYNSDRNTTGDGFLSFSVNQPVTVIIAVDDMASHLPAWLMAWRKRPGKLLLSGSFSRRDMYAKDFPTGEVVLSANRDYNTPQARSMYSVIVLPLLATASEWGSYP